MLTEKDYCDYETCVALKELGYNRGAYAYYFPNHKEDLIFNTHQMRGCSINEMLKGYNTYPKNVMGHELIDAPTMWEAQKWLREEKGIHIAPRIYLYHDINLDEHTSWECTIYVEWSAIYTIGKSLTYEEALLLGIKEAVKILKEK
jgi:hypothetical protein